ncbi:MAG: response regulator [Verrucomicrobiota bacterium]
MKLKTNLQLSAVIPIVFAIAVTLLLMWQFRSTAAADLLDTPFVAVLGLLGVIMAAVVVSYSRDILKKIRILDAWTDTILKGNLDYHAEMDSSDDEIGRLSAALSKLIREVKEASTALHEQVEEHRREADKQKQNAASSQEGMRHMAQAIGRFKGAQEEVVHKERQRVLKQVVRGVIHELSDALTPVLGAGDLVCAHPEMLKDQAWTLQQVETMHAGVHRARKSLKNLAGVFHQPQQETQPLDLNLAVKRGLALAETRWKEEGLADKVPVRIQTDFAVTATVLGEDTDIEDAVAALILNSMEAMPGGGTITVSTMIHGPSAVLEVRDSGKGMSDEVRNRCLDPFYSTKKRMRSGMGLTMVASTVYRHGGSLEIRSEAGQGTRIFVSLPLWKERGAEKALDLQDVRGGNLRILVVDDDAWTREAIKQALNAMGHTAEAVADGQQGLVRLKAEKCDVVFVDWAMPVMSGDRLAVAIKQTLPYMPIIMLTAFGHGMIAEENIPPCIDVVLLKPVTMEDLGNAIAQARAKVGEGAADKKGIAPEDWDWTGAARK